ncbi:MAG TPA: hypothetical protein DDY49_04445 [Paenibacillaceae bacterium]|nr:hypothetical protein [Paenibacillaceae bacterium]
MFLPLMGKEMKYQLKGITFYLFFGIVLLFYFTQFVPSMEIPKPPVANSQGVYGFVPMEDQGDKMKAVYNWMTQDVQRGEILTYGFMINKEVRLSEEKKQFIQEAMNRLASQGEISVSYEEFLTIVGDLDQKLGGSTTYSDEWRDDSLRRPMTYEEAVQKYKDLIEKDKVTGAFGRLFADYMGITAGIFPIFLGAFVLTRDKRTRAHEIIYSRKISSITYVLSKYFGILTLVTLCYLVLATATTFYYMNMASTQNLVIDDLAFYKYTFAWIVPTAMFSIALGMLVSVIFGNGIVAIPLQFVLWIQSMLPLQGEYGLSKMVVRFNGLGFTEEYLSWFNAIAMNRVFYAALSLGILFLVAWVWSMKRGVGNGPRKV